ncbi:hypothetical protein FOL47_006936 [Perkinsus chesapeaki]|uniref:Uncharacterized protein n=1 Tax=Perkinsus chesapeaki TaxID=330153 RepID=A0A7J6LNG8_PERCH|nr:hypothetical protein FOL47_006936 [Perkinsus chesapeaki]
MIDMLNSFFFAVCFRSSLHGEAAPDEVSPLSKVNQEGCSGGNKKVPNSGAGNKDQSSAARVAQARAAAARTSRSKVRQQRGVSVGQGAQNELAGTVGRTRTLSPQEEANEGGKGTRRWSDMTSDEDSEPATSKLRKFDPPRRSFSSIVSGGLVKKGSEGAVSKAAAVVKGGSPVGRAMNGGSKTKGRQAKSCRTSKSGEVPSAPVSPRESLNASLPTIGMVKACPCEQQAKISRGGKGSEPSPTASPAARPSSVGGGAAAGCGSSPKGNRGKASGVAATAAAQGGSALPSKKTTAVAKGSSATTTTTSTSVGVRKGGEGRTSPRGRMRGEKLVRNEMETVPEEGEVDYGAESMETAHWATMPPAGQFHPLPGFYPPGAVPPMMMFPAPAGYPAPPGPYTGIHMMPPPQGGFGPLMGSLPPFEHVNNGPEASEEKCGGKTTKKKGSGSKGGGGSQAKQTKSPRVNQAGCAAANPTGGQQYQLPMYGHIRHHPTATIVYTTSPIPQDTTSIILVPMSNPHQQGAGRPAGIPIMPLAYPPPMPAQFDTSYFDGGDYSPPSPPITHPPSGPQSLRSVRTHSVASEASFDGTRPVTVCVDRNAFKSWFDTDVPEFQQLRVKRYRTIDSFVHWMMKYCKRKSIYHGLYILVRVTDAEKLLEVLTRLIPTWHSVVMGIYVYEQSRGKVGKPLQRRVAQHLPIRHDPRVTIVDTLAETCRLAIASGAGVDAALNISPSPLKAKEDEMKKEIIS